MESCGLIDYTETTNSNTSLIWKHPLRLPGLTGSLIDIPLQCLVAQASTRSPESSGK